MSGRGEIRKGELADHTTAKNAPRTLFLNMMGREQHKDEGMIEESLKNRLVYSRVGGGKASGRDKARDFCAHPGAVKKKDMGQRIAAHKKKIHTINVHLAIAIPSEDSKGGWKREVDMSSSGKSR